jgi:Mg-chelatase subunit ChlI
MATLLNVALVAGAISRLLIDRFAPKTSTLGLAKLNRRREVIEERLKKLETLRAADPESLLRNRGND